MEKIDAIARPAEKQRAFFECENWTDEDLDTIVELLKTYPGGEFLSGLSLQAQRNYAMSCIWLKERDPYRYEHCIVLGKLWFKSMTTAGYG